MAFQSVRSELVTRPTLAAFRNAALPVDPDHPAVVRLADSRRAPAQDLTLTIYKSLTVVEDEWRRFEAVAECTPFQTYEWLAAWERHVGRREAVTAAIVVGRFADGKTAIILLLAVWARRSVRRLCWFGQELCDYNAPLLARDFSQRVTPGGFLALWQEVRAQVQSDPGLRHDWIDFEKMPETIGAQINPFTYLAVIQNANSAHITQLGDEWETFYRQVRSSATRWRDRAKRKRMAEFGDIRFVTAAAPDEIRQMLETLWRQNKRIFARKGISDIFSRPGYRDFFLDFAADPQTRHPAHVSRLEVCDKCAAANFAITFGAIVTIS